MKKIRVNQYIIDSICNKMKKEFGSISKGSEGEYVFEMFAIEEILLKEHLKNPDLNCRQGKEILSVCLLKVKEYLEDIEYDFGKNIDDIVLELANKVSQTFIPFENEKLKNAIEGLIEIDSKAKLKEYFTIPIKCIIRIYSSIELWEKERGRYGYYEFLKENILDSIDVNSEEVHFAVRFNKE
jgi:hypothetical protein